MVSQRDRLCGWVMMLMLPPRCTCTWRAGCWPHSSVEIVRKVRFFDPTTDHTWNNLLCVQCTSRNILSTTINNCEHVAERVCVRILKRIFGRSSWWAFLRYTQSFRNSLLQQLLLLLCCWHNWWAWRLALPPTVVNAIQMTIMWRWQWHQWETSSLQQCRCWDNSKTTINQLGGLACLLLFSHMCRKVMPQQLWLSRFHNDCDYSWNKILLGEGSHLVENLSLNAHGVGERVTQNQETGPFILLSSVHLRVKTAAMAMSPLKEFPNLYDDYDSTDEQRSKHD
jgi:hypothetical protein